MPTTTLPSQHAHGLHGHMYSYHGEFEQRERPPYPLVTVVEDNEVVHMRALMPGASPRHIRLIFHKGILILQGNIPPVEGSFFRQERFSGNFQRTIKLPAPVLAQKARARMKDGVLDLILPKVLY